MTIREDSEVMLIEKHISSLAVELCAVLQKMLTGYPEVQTVTGKGELKLITISYLRTSVLDHQPLYRVDLYDEAQYNDFHEYWAYWNVDIISKKIYEQNPIPELRLSEREKSLEIERNRCEDADRLHAALGGYMEEIWRQAFAGTNMGLAQNSKIQFGEYLSSYIQIGRK